MSLQLIQNLEPRKCHKDCESAYLAIYDCGEDEPQQYVLLCKSTFSDKDFKKFAEIYDLESGKLVSFEVEESDNFEELIKQRRSEFQDNGICNKHIPVTASVKDVIIKQCAVCAKQLDKQYQGGRN